MEPKKTFTFTVEGIGTFEALGEYPATQLFKRRDELANVCGGIGQLIDLEARVRSYEGSQNPIEKDIFLNANLELIYRQTYVEMKKTLTKAPDKFVLDQLTDDQFDKLVAEYRKQKEFFRNPQKAEGSETVPSTESNK